MRLHRWLHMQPRIFRPNMLVREYLGIALGLATIGSAACYAPPPIAARSGTALPYEPPAPRKETHSTRDNVGVFAAGQCDFGNCSTNGWTSSTPDGEQVRSRCAFGDCLKNGWSTEAPGGARSDSRCNFGDCTKNGWTTRVSGGAETRTTCNFNDCTKNGWTTESPSGRSRTTCAFNDCNKSGWTTETSDGHRATCTCKFGDCQKNGADCR